MTDKSPAVASNPSGIEISLALVPQLIKKKGKDTIVKNEDGNTVYRRSDAHVLYGLLKKLNTKLHPTRDWVYWPKIERKLEEAFYTESTTITLTIGESAFLKGYLVSLPEKEGKDMQFSGQEVETMETVKAQLPE